jgi:transcriptional regulator NrdR family protein
MIPCPKCGGDTSVSETRGDRRRRICKDFSCGGRLTTREMPVDDIKMVMQLMGGGR